MRVAAEAILRASGLLSLPIKRTSFKDETEALAGAGRRLPARDTSPPAASRRALEGVRVLFIVIAVGLPATDSHSSEAMVRRGPFIGGGGGVLAIASGGHNRWPNVRRTH